MSINWTVSDNSNVTTTINVSGNSSTVNVSSNGPSFHVCLKCGMIILHDEHIGMYVISRQLFDELDHKCYAGTVSKDTVIVYLCEDCNKKFNQVYSKVKKCPIDKQWGKAWFNLLNLKPHRPFIFR